MSQYTYKVKGLDCAEEVAILKREVGPLVGGEERLSFNILGGKMTVAAPDGVSATDIETAVNRTGMTAVPWEEAARAPVMESGWRSTWERRGRTILCAASGILMLNALVAHAIEGGVLNAFAGEGAYPVLVKVFYLAAAVSGAWFILPKAWYAARRLRPDMNLLMTVAVIGAILIGEWFEAAAVAFLFSLALLLESWSVGRARRAIESLMELAPTKARYICPHDGDIEEKHVEHVPIGVTAIVRPGEKIPLDGVIEKGTTTVNQAAITGESMPVEKGPGDEVYAGSINNEGAFQFKVTKEAGDTTLSRIIHMVEEAEGRRAPVEQWVDRFAQYYTPAMMALAIGIAVVPPLFDGAWLAWLYQALVILVIACPCALVISTPVSVVAGLASAARHGVLIKGGVFLELPARLRAIAIDKTGTLTHGRPTVQEIVPLNGHTADELLQRAAAMEAHSEHPIAQAVLEKANAENIAYEPAEDFQAVKGKGASGKVFDREFWIGSHRYLHEKGRETPECHDKAVALEDAGHSVVAIGNDEHVCGLISVADALRDETASAVADLRAAGVEHVVMLTGDNAGTAQAIAEATGVDEHRAELLPEDKVAAVQELVRRYKWVGMVGDGVNDAPAMAQANVGIAMGAAGTDAAIETADIALMSDDLTKISWLIHHSKRTLRIIRENIALALGIKAVFVVLALAGWATLWMAIAADMGASLLVIFNGLRLLRA